MRAAPEAAAQGRRMIPALPGLLVAPRDNERAGAGVI
jgi:hypothetical protein